MAADVQPDTGRANRRIDGWLGAGVRADQQPGEPVAARTWRRRDASAHRRLAERFLAVGQRAAARLSARQADLGGGLSILRHAHPRRGDEG